MRIYRGGLISRKMDLKRQLCKIIKDSRTLKLPTTRNGVKDLEPYWNYVNELMVTLLTSITEFRIAHIVKNLDHSLKFTVERSHKYPDLGF